MSKDQSPSVNKLRSGAVLMALLAVCACDTLDKRAVGTVGHVKGFAGMIATDEPRAALIGRDVLSAGGTAADAATAAYFALAVTYPSAASLGGGGSCIVYDPVRKKAEVMEFPSTPSTLAGQIPTAVPANPRGFFALHAKYGKLRHESLLVEAEKLARNGTTVSRALAIDLDRAMPVLGRDPAARAIFFRSDGSILREGDLLVQPELAAVIANLRKATGDFYVGLGARDLVKAVKTASGSLSLEDLRDFKPSWRDPLTVKVGKETAYFAPPPSVGSTLTGELIGALWDRWDGVSPAERPHLLAEASARTFADRARWMNANGWTSEEPGKLLAPARLASLMTGYNPDRHTPVTGIANPPADGWVSASIAVIDSTGQAVSCSVSAQGPFGVGKVAPGTGILLAGAPGPFGPPPLANMITVNPNSNEIHFVGASSGGGAAPVALAQTFMIAAGDSKSLVEALAAPRLAHPGNPDGAFIEDGPYAVDAVPLERRGHQFTRVPMPSRVQAVHCPSGYKNSDGCEVATDPRGAGMAVMAGTR